MLVRARGSKRGWVRVRALEKGWPLALRLRLRLRLGLARERELALVLALVPVQAPRREMETGQRSGLAAAPGPPARGW